MECYRADFINALNNFVEEIELCLRRNILTKHGKISVKGCSSKKIKEGLQFLDKLNYKANIRIGNAGGVLGDTHGIAFFRCDVVGQDSINGKSCSKSDGIYIWISYEYVKKLITIRFNYCNNKPLPSSFVSKNIDFNSFNFQTKVNKDLLDKQISNLNKDSKQGVLSKECAKKAWEDFKKIKLYFDSFKKEDFKIEHIIRY